MTIPQTFYGTVAEGDTYFGARLHPKAWDTSAPIDKEKALRNATQIIDTLAFKGCKNAVHVLLLASPDATEEQIRAAEASQEREFPRGADTTVPEDIAIATYQIADALLDDVDPELELENLMVNEQKFADVKIAFSRRNVPNDHILNGVPSATAWRYLQPFLRDGRAIKHVRV